MPTKIYLAVAREDGSGSLSVIVAEEFDNVIDQIYPVQGPSSSLESRTNQLFTTLDGRRLLVHPANVFLVEADPEIE